MEEEWGRGYATRAENEGARGQGEERRRTTSRSAVIGCCGLLQSERGGDRNELSVPTVHLIVQTRVGVVVGECACGGVVVHVLRSG